MTDSPIDFASRLFTDRSNARKAALKRFGLEPSEFKIITITNGPNKKFRIEPRPGAIADATAAAKENLILTVAAEKPPLPKRPANKTPADRGIQAAKEEAAARKMTPKMAEIEKAQIRAADPLNRAAEAAEIFALKRPDRRHLAALDAAYAGKMPEIPDLSAAAHVFYRKHLAKAVELAKAKDLSGLAAYIATIRPACSSRKPIVAYGKLALIALSR